MRGTLHSELNIVKNLNVKINLNYTKISSPYRAVNTLRLGYKNQSVNVV